MKNLCKRTWLNPLSSSDTGWVKVDAWEDQGWLVAGLDIADCYHHITLDFGCNKDTLPTRLKKLRKLQDMLNELEEWMIEAGLEMEDEE